MPKTPASGLLKTTASVSSEVLDSTEVNEQELEAQYLDEGVRRLSLALESAYEARAELVSTGGDTAKIQDEILTLRRRLREGGELKAGDYLLDGRFKLLEAVGRGGFAKVWKAYDKKTRCIVAVKVLHGQYRNDKSRRERFFRGAKKMDRLKHRRIVRVIEACLQDGNFHFFVMEFLRGGNLKKAVLAGRFSELQRLRIILRIGRALTYAHERELIHRDIKPDNILLDLEGEPKLTDFDLVRALDSTGGTRTGMLGTVVYAAPEVMKRAQDADARADVYGLGMTAVFTFYGRDLPLDALRAPQNFIRNLDLSEATRAALAKAVSWDPERRFQSVEDFCQFLKRSWGESSYWAGIGPPPASRRPPLPGGPSIAFNYAKKEINCKILYFSAPRAGARTNMRYIQQKTDPEFRPPQDILRSSYASNRTIFFDIKLEPGFNIRGFTFCFHLYRVPMLPFSEGSRKMVFPRTTGAVFVADSREKRQYSNFESMKQMRDALGEYGVNLDTLPYALQLNKRDLPGIVPAEQMYRNLNYKKEPYFEAVAIRGQGVFDTLKAVAHQIAIALRKR